MKYVYKPEVLSNGYTEVFVFRLPREIALVEVFLGSDVQTREGSGEFFLKALDQVISGQEETLLVSGNICALEIHKDRTHVMDMLADDGLGDACWIETEELKKLILIWLDELEAFNEQQKS